MCFSEQLGRVGSCCLSVGWCQGATPFGVPIKTGVGFTAQEADHEEWSLSMCRTWSLGVCPAPGTTLHACGKWFFWERARDRFSPVLAAGTASRARLFLVLCQALPDVPVSLGTAQSPGLSAYALEMEGISSKHGVHGQELFSGMLYVQVQYILGCLRNGLRVSSVEKLHSVYKMFTYVWLCQHLKYK